MSDFALQKKCMSINENNLFSFTFTVFYNYNTLFFPFPNDAILRKINLDV